MQPWCHDSRRPSKVNVVYNTIYRIFGCDRHASLTADGAYTYAGVRFPVRFGSDHRTPANGDGENHLASTNVVTYIYDGDGKRAGSVGAFPTVGPFPVQKREAKRGQRRAPIRSGLGGFCGPSTAEFLRDETMRYPAPGNNSR